jgi:hypothetical protein
VFLVVLKLYLVNIICLKRSKNCVKLKQVLAILFYRIMKLVYYYYYDTLFGHCNIKLSKLLSWSLVLSPSSGKIQKEKYNVMPLIQ